jgi:hypothetical protein
MRSKIFLLIIVGCLAVISARSQFFIDSRRYNNINDWYRWPGGTFYNNLNIPKVQATTGRDTGGIRYSIIDSTIHVWTGSQWRALGGGGSISDGDKGDITVSSSGTVWTIDNLAVTNAKINDVVWSKITGTPTTILGYGITDPIVLTSSSYADPAWITSLAWSKITGLAFTNGVKEAAGTVTAGGYFEADSISYISNSSKIFRVQSRTSASSLFYGNYQYGPSAFALFLSGGHADTYSRITGTTSQLEARVNHSSGYYSDFLMGAGSASLRSYNGSSGRQLWVLPSSVYITDAAGGNITNSFGADSSTHFKKLVYDTYDSANYTALTLIPKQYLEDRLAGISGGGGATELKNAATGYRLAIEGTDSVKVLEAGAGLALDSSTYGKVIISATNVDSSAARVRTGTYSDRVAIVSPENGEVFTQTDRLAGLYIYNQGSWRFQGDPMSYWFYNQFSRMTTGSSPDDGYNALMNISGATGSDFNVLQLAHSDNWLSALLKTTDVTIGTTLYDSIEVDSVILYLETEFIIDSLSNGTDSYGISFGFDNAIGNYLSGDRIIFRYNHAVNGGEWETRTVAAGSGTWTTKDTNVPFSANTRTKLAMEIDGYSQSIKFYINDVLVTTHASPDNVPFPNATTLATGISPCEFNFDRLAGSTTRNPKVNYIFGYYVKKNF